MCKELVVALCMVGLVCVWAIAYAAPENFKSPQLQNEIRPSYPQGRFRARANEKSNLRSEDSGVVELTYMVDQQGNPYEIKVLRSTLEKFEDAAINAVQRYRFDPAMLGSQPVDSHQTSDVVFRYSARDAESISGARASRRNYLDTETPYTFDAYYQQFLDEVAKVEPRQSQSAQLIKKMARLEDQTFASIAYTASARARFADLFSEPPQRIEEYQNMIWLNYRLPEQNQPLRGELEPAAWSQMIALQLQSGLFADALAAYAAAEQKGIKLDSAVVNHRNKLPTLRQDGEKVTQRPIDIGPRGYAQVLVFKPSFEIVNLQGTIESLNLRCDTKFKVLEFQPDTNKRIPESWGECALQIIGTVGSKADLLEN